MRNTNAGRKQSKSDFRFLLHIFLVPRTNQGVMRQFLTWTWSDSCDKVCFLQTKTEELDLESTKLFRIPSVDSLIPEDISHKQQWRQSWGSTMHGILMVKINESSVQAKWTFHFLKLCFSFSLTLFSRPWTCYTTYSSTTAGKCKTKTWSCNICWYPQEYKKSFELERVELRVRHELDFQALRSYVLD